MGPSQRTRVARIDTRDWRFSRWTLALLLGAALSGFPIAVPAANAAVSFLRTDTFLSARPESVALGDLDGQHGKDIVVALPLAGSVGVMLNYGDGTFAPMQTYTAGPSCAGPRSTSRSAT